MAARRGRGCNAIAAAVLLLALPGSGAFLGPSLFSLGGLLRTAQIEQRPSVRQVCLAATAAAAQDLPSIGWDPSLLVADVLGIKPEIIGRESWAWSHASRNGGSVVLLLTARIEEEGGRDKASPGLIRTRRRMMSLLLQHDYGSYMQAATALGGLIDRKDLPNVQDIPYPSMPGEAPRKALLHRRQRPGPAGGGVSGGAEGAVVPDCTLPSVSFKENLLDKFLLSVFRILVQKETGFISPKEGILGLLDEGREYMLRPQQTAEAQHNMVCKVLSVLMTPVMPPLYCTFITGIYNGKQIGPWPWAAFITSLFTPVFFSFLVGPSRPNRRIDGSLGGLVVERCKFLQESGCKGLCMNQCKLPAQQFFADSLGLPLTVSPNFESQECQWSFGEVPTPSEKDPRIPRGCLAGCPQALHERSRQSRTMSRQNE